MAFVAGLATALGVFLATAGMGVALLEEARGAADRAVAAQMTSQTNFLSNRLRTLMIRHGLMPTDFEVAEADLSPETAANLSEFRRAVADFSGSWMFDAVLISHSGGVYLSTMPAISTGVSASHGAEGAGALLAAIDGLIAEQPGPAVLMAGQQGMVSLRGRGHVFRVSPLSTTSWPLYVVTLVPAIPTAGAMDIPSRWQVVAAAIAAALTMGLLVAMVVRHGLSPLTAALATAAAAGGYREIAPISRQVADAMRSLDRLRRWQSVANLQGRTGWFEHVAGQPTQFDVGIRALVGASADRLGDALEDWWSLVHPDDRQRVTDAYARFLASPETPFDLDYRVDDGTTCGRFVRTICTAERTANGHVVRVFGSCTDISAQRDAEDRIKQNAYTDKLTGLPNRAQFMERLGGELARIRSGKLAPHYVFYLDLDRFKTINDTLGQAAGDDMLIACARRLEQSMGPETLVSRIGSDQFAILAPVGAPHVDMAGLRRLAAGIRDAIQRPMMLIGQEIFPTASIGVAVCGPGYARAEDILADAMLAMSVAKGRGRGNLQVFEHHLRTPSVADSLALESDLRRALERNELHLHYQPVVSMATGALAGFEALMRWRNDRRGSVSPDQFISLAEENGLIVPMGAWALEEACRQLAHLNARRHGQDPLFISVNVSRRQLEDAHLIDHLAHALRTSGIDPACLRLEVTESLLIDQTDSVARLLAGLKAQGVRLSIDDFGTGYSSLDRLHRLPFDTVKIDKSFVTDMMSDPRSALIVGAVVDLAHALDLDVVAEGAESEADVRALTDAGCDYGQGYIFGRPMPVADLDAVLKDRRLGPMPAEAAPDADPRVVRLSDRPRPPQT